MATANSLPFSPPLKMSGTLSTEWKRFGGEMGKLRRCDRPDDLARYAGVFIVCIGTDA